MEEVINEAIFGLIRKHEIAVDNLTKLQLAEAIKQAIKSGDFRKRIYVTSNTQQVIYLPGIGLDEILVKYHQLIYAVESIYEHESRHETALRYIKEREQQKYSNPPDQSK